MDSIIDLRVINEFNVRELKEAQSKIEQLWGRDLKERIKARKAIAEVRFSELFTVADYLDCYFVRAYVSENVSDFKEGESIRIHQGSPRSYVAKGQIYSIDRGGDLIVGFSSYDLRNAQLLDTISYYTIDKDVVNMSKIYDAALFRLQEWMLRDQLLGILNGILPATYNAIRMKEVLHYIDRYGPMLNVTQREAIVKAVTADRFHLIQGPPGTGKTHVLALIALILAEVKGERVLITAPTHLAINNALAKCVSIGFPLERIQKIGQRFNREGLKNEVWEISSREHISEFEFLLTERTITGISPFHLHTTRARNLEFDTVIIDEAGQMNCSVAMMAMCCAKRYLLVGDHKQMAPIFASTEHPPLLKLSVFELLFRRGKASLLDVTYRMNEVIAAFPSAMFYDGKLATFDDHIGRRLQLKQTLPEYLSGRHPMVFLELDHSDCTVCSPSEAQVVVNSIETLLKAGVDASEIAVVTPFKAQGRLIRTMLFHLQDFGHELLKSIVVDTVERMQGQEREVIIVSLVSSNETFIKEIGEFYFQPNRLNVAVTRAKNKLIVVGSRHLRRLHASDELIEAGMRVYDCFLDSCKLFRLI